MAGNPIHTNRTVWLFPSLLSLFMASVYDVILVPRCGQPKFSSGHAHTALFIIAFLFHTGQNVMLINPLVLDENEISLHNLKRT